MSILKINKELGLIPKTEQEQNMDFLKEYQALCKKYNRQLVPSLNFQLTKLQNDNGTIPGANPPNQPNA